MKKDVVIVGAGPAGIFTALEMLKNNFETLSAIKENFDKTCFASYPNDGSLK